VIEDEVHLVSQRFKGCLASSSINFVAFSGFLVLESLCLDYALYTKRILFAIRDSRM